MLESEPDLFVPELDLFDPILDLLEFESDLPELELDLLVLDPELDFSLECEEELLSNTISSSSFNNSFEH